jgi:hypothetical protein
LNRDPIEKLFIRGLSMAAKGGGLQPLRLEIFGGIANQDGFATIRLPPGDRPACCFNHKPSRFQLGIASHHK